MGDGPLNRAIFLDRDGVINRAIVRNGLPYSPATLDEFEILPDVPGALDRLRTANFRLVVVTNQPDIARGKQTRAALEAMHARLAPLRLDSIRVCPHDDRDGCTCRKPKPGMLIDAAADLSVDLAASYLVGDRWRDVEAGRSAGCTTVLLDYGYAEAVNVPPDHRAGSLAEAVDWILAQ